MSKFTNKIPNFMKTKWGIAGVIALVLILGGYMIFSKETVYQYVSVTKGNITETISLTGNTTPAQSVSLSFGSSGVIAHAYTSLGKKVNKGQILADLNSADLIAQLHQAEAAYSVAKTNYTKLVNGASNPDIEIARVALKNAQDSYNSVVAEQKVVVANAHTTLLSSGLVAVPTNSTTSSSDSPTISGAYNSTIEGTYNITTYGTSGSAYFSISGLENGSGIVSTTPTAFGNRGLFIQFPTGFTSSTTSWTVTLPNTNSSTYLTYYNAYQLAIQNQSQAIDTARGAVNAAQAALDLKLAGARSEDLDISKAQIDQAAANVEAIAARIANARIVAPITGTITQYDAKVGQLASLSSPLVSIMSDTGYEVDAGVSETDIGKIVVGNKVTMTLDAFPNENFSGTVFYIAPSETNTSGVVSYLVKISFDVEDPRLKSGLTANIDIQTKYRENVLILPQYAILQNDSGTFVETLVNNKVVQNKVLLGITDQKGNVEIVSGVTEGEQVLNIGLKI